ncbi:Protein SCO1-like protein 1 [Forsythia ovata]|uniref:Protein SCO1-like protein 1 n=1 Tax=Forsythia ovata TaxID=205694 RepID=A0ABD1SLJ9_9LAMI
MSSAISRSLRLRSIYSSITAQWRLNNLSFHGLPENSRHFPSDFCIDDRYRKTPAFAAINFKFLCTTATGNATNQSNTNATATGTSASGWSEGDSGNSNDGKSSGGPHGKPVRSGPVSWMSFFLLFCTGAGLVYYYDREKKRHIEGIDSASNAVKQGPSVGKAAIGGPFNLIDHNGKAVTDNNFVGKWNMIYFGFTHCPDICPDELQKLAAAIDRIKEKSGMEVVPVFISVDPERDTVEQVREYVKEFHPKLIGLTGSPDEIKKAARAYRVYYMKTEEEGSDYLVDHSIVMYLMDPNMQFVKFFGKNVDADSLADGVIQEIKQHKMVKA